MGLLRNVAKKVVGRIRGQDDGGGGPATHAAATAGSVTRPTPATPAADSGDAIAEAEAFQSMECGAQELKERLDAGEEVVIVDVRQPAELRSGILPGARLIPLPDLQARWTELQDADEIVLYCAMGARSLQAATFLRGQGLINATSLEGGIGAWRSAGGRTVDPD